MQVEDAEDGTYCDPVSRRLREDALSESCSFVLCDAIEIGFPLAYISRGFIELMEYNHDDCIGKKCGAVVCRKTMMQDVSKVLGLREDECDIRIARTSRFVAASCVKALADWPGKAVTSVFVLNQKKGGSLFVCEHAICTLKHPLLDRFYMVGCQRDSSASISIERLFDAAQDDATYEALVASQTMSFYDLLNDANVTFFHSKMEEVWHERARKLLQDLNPTLSTPSWQPRKRGPTKNSARKLLTDNSPVRGESDETEINAMIAFDRQISTATGTSFCLSDWTAVAELNNERVDQATQTDICTTEPWRAFPSPPSSAPPASRKRPGSAPPAPETDADSLHSGSPSRPPVLPFLPSKFDGVWNAIPDKLRGLPEQWLRTLHIRGDQVTDGTGLSIAMQRDKQGNFILENGILSIQNDFLHRDGKSGRRVSFRRVQRPSPRQSGDRVSFRDCGD